MSKASVPYHDRAQLPNTSPLASYLFRLMAAKKTNLGLAADVESTSMLLTLAEECGDSICVLKTHADIIHDFGERTIKALMEIAARKKFLIFEDRKFADIGRAVQLQYAAGPHRIASWASIVNAHTISGPGIITALKSAALSSLAMFHTSISTEITSGGPYEDDYFTNAQQQFANFQLGNDDNNEEREEYETELEYHYEKDHESDDDDDAVTRKGSVNSVIMRRGSSLDQRKQSVVSISTTISSSTEFISPPDTNPSSPAANAAPLSMSTIERPPVARGLLLLTQMLTKDNLITPEYRKQTIDMARQHRDFVLGFISQDDMNAEDDDNFISFAPGVLMPDLEGDCATPPRTSKAARSGPLSASRRRELNPSVKTLLERDSDVDDLIGPEGMGLQNNTPRRVIYHNGADVAIAVCAGIVGSEDHAAETERYRKEAWEAYLERIKKPRA